MRPAAIFSTTSTFDVNVDVGVGVDVDVYVDVDVDVDVGVDVQMHDSLNLSTGRCVQRKKDDWARSRKTSN